MTLNDIRHAIANEGDGSRRRLDFTTHAQAMLEDIFPTSMPVADLVPLLTHRIAILMDDAVKGLCDMTTPPRSEW
jgi:hypothetical protein